MLIMVVAAHPDDAEFGAAGTIAKWVREGHEAVYVVCTSGDKGSSDPEMTPEKLARIREQEQQEAARTVGVKEVIFLRHPDGYLEDTPEFRGEIVKLFRQWRPEVVMTCENHRKTLWHRDHRIVGTVVLDAVYPYARDRLFYPEHLAEGLQPHKVKEVYLWGTEEPDTFIDIGETFELKLKALRCHRSQIAPEMWKEIEKRVRERLSGAKQDQGIPLSEPFRHLEVPF